MTRKSFGLSDIGVRRSNNEDVWIAIPEIGFYALADGMGGHRAGEVAAREAIDHLCASVQAIKRQHRADPLELMGALEEAIEQANQWVYGLGQKTNSWNGMGTTLCCLIWAEGVVVYAHVGDSRIYRLRKGKLELLTQDHSLFAKWLKIGRTSGTPFPYKNVITRAVGTASKANPEIAFSLYEPGDLFFLCTDGLSDVLSLPELEEVINSSADLESASKSLIQKAKFKGSSDNITILMVQSEDQIEDWSGKNLPRQQRDDSPRSEGLQGDAQGPERSAGEPI